jgi:hypothetical protein
MTSTSAAHSSFPKAIPFPRIDRPHHRSCGGLAGVRKASDLPSRLIFGDLDESSFKTSGEGWAVAFRDGTGNGLALSVCGRQFTAKPNFLGASGLSCGPVDPPRAFGELLNLGAAQWQGRLKNHLEARYPVNVPEHDPHQTSVLYLPDGWLHTILVPVAPERLPGLLDWHLSLADDPRLAACMAGSVVLAFNAVNYIEGRWQDELDPASLAFRSLSLTGTPLVGEVLRETGRDGTCALTVRRVAYVYRCTAFLRDLPFIVASLDAANLLPAEPDLRAALLPSNLALAAESMSWLPPSRDCRITWAWLEDQAAGVLAICDATAVSAGQLIHEALAAAREFDEAIGLSAALDSAAEEGGRK